MFTSLTLNNQNEAPSTFPGAVLLFLLLLLSKHPFRFYSYQPLKYQGKKEEFQQPGGLKPESENKVEQDLLFLLKQGQQKHFQPDSLCFL